MSLEQLLRQFVQEFLRAEKKTANKITRIADHAIEGIDPTDPENIEPVSEILRRANYKIARNSLEDMYVLGISHVAKELSESLKIRALPFDNKINAADDYLLSKLTEHTVNSLSRIADDIKPDLIASLKEGLRHGENQEQLAARIAQIWDIERSRALAFTITEGNEVYNQAHLFKYIESGVVHGVEFRAVMDERTSPICQMYNGTIWAIGDPDIQRPPLHYHCRSRLVPYFGKIPGERDFTELSDGSTIPQGQVDKLDNQLEKFKTKYWQVPQLKRRIQR